uniref:Uncharacterized protein n=1 Tax=Rhizophora mucronata TaxID=61149 RepID=A0A2P2Q680_RHIMU
MNTKSSFCMQLNFPIVWRSLYVCPILAMLKNLPHLYKQKPTEVQP